MVSPFGRDETRIAVRTAYGWAGVRISVGGMVDGNRAAVRAADRRVGAGGENGGVGLVPGLAQDAEDAVGVLCSGDCVLAVDHDERRAGGPQTLCLLPLVPHLLPEAALGEYAPGLLALQTDLVGQVEPSRNGSYWQAVTNAGGSPRRGETADARSQRLKTSSAWSRLVVCRSQ
ncbi:hypothetical protein GCM10023083_83890 [Streptomyces phyllanthi]